MSTGERERMPALDGVRGLAIVLVVTQHVGVGVPFLNHFGEVGVAVFFVLSGYLITRILLAGGPIDLRRFYARRARRLLPALLLLLAVTPAILWVLGEPVLKGAKVDVPLAGLYLMDFAVASGRDVSVLGHTWSLAVEEQFYLVWPVVLIATIRARVNVTRVVLTLLGIAFAWRLAATLMYGMERVYFAPDTSAYALLVGCALASLERDGRLPVLNWRVASLAGVALAAISTTPAFPRDIQWMQIAAVALAVPLIVSARTASAGWLSSRLMQWFGKVSYGWYLWHGLLVWVALGHYGPVGRLIMGAFSLGVAWLSWRYVEQPFMRRRASVREVADAVSRPLVGEVHAVR